MIDYKENIEQQVTGLINYYYDPQNVEEVPIDTLKTMYKDVKKYDIKLNIEQSVAKLQSIFNKFEVRGEQLYILQIAIDNVLTEREQDKKRIKEKYVAREKIEEYLKDEQERFEVYKRESKANENLKPGMWKHLGAKNMCEKILGIEKNIVTLD